MAENKDKKVLNVPNKRELTPNELGSAEHKEVRLKRNVPNLRFKEFEGEWKEKRLGNICTFYSGGTPTSSNNKYYGGNIPFIRSGELHKAKTELMITEEGYNNSSAKMVEKGDLLLAMYGATSGDIAISRIKGAINQAILCIKTNHNKKFLETIWSKHVNRILKTYLQGGQGNLSADVVKQITFSIPTIQEQEKLAQLFFILDERITTQNKIIEELKQLKNGIIETHYKQVKKKEVSIKELGKPFSVGNLSKEYLSFKGKPCVLYGELFTTYGETINQIKSYTEKEEGIILSKKGDLLFPSSTTVDAISLIAPSVINIDDVVLGGDMFGIRINAQFNSQYLSYFFNHIAKRQLSKYAKGSTIIHLHYKDIEKAKLLLPCLEEQNKMAQYLIALDEKINIENNYIASLEYQKTYLLRQMFI